MKRKDELKEIRNSSEQDFAELHLQKCRALFDLRNQKSQNKKLDKPHRLRATRKEIARLLTVQRQRELGRG